MAEKDSRYVFRASEAPLIDAGPALKVKEAHMLDGMALRYQEYSPGGPPDEMWCETGHSAYILSGRLRRYLAREAQKTVR